MALVALLITGPVEAQSFRRAVCGESAKLIADLMKLYQEAPVQEAVTTANEQVMIFADPDEQTWTLVLFSPNGKAACSLIAGFGQWLDLVPSIPGVDG